MQGTVKSLVLNKGFGFIAPAGSKLGDVFFHVRELSPDLAFDETLLERRVEFQATETDKGTRAENIHAAN